MRTDRMRLLCSLLTLLPCALAWGGCGLLGDDPDCSGPDGSWSDVTTEHGAYQGYELRASCLPDADVISILGTGQRWSQEIAIGASGRKAAFYDLADRVALALPEQRRRYFVDGGPAQGCTNAEAVHVTLSDWHDVDATIRTAAQLLAAGQLREEVLIEVDSLCSAY